MKNGFPSEPSEMPIDLSSLAEATFAPITSAAPASKTFFNMFPIPS